MHALTESDDGMLADTVLPPDSPAERLLALLESVWPGLPVEFTVEPYVTEPYDAEAYIVVAHVIEPYDAVPHVAVACSAEPFDLTSTGF